MEHLHFRHVKNIVRKNLDIPWMAIPFWNTENKFIHEILKDSVESIAWVWNTKKTDILYDESSCSNLNTDHPVFWLVCKEYALCFSLEKLISGFVYKRKNSLYYVDYEYGARIIIQYLYRCYIEHLIYRLENGNVKYMKRRFEFSRRSFDSNDALEIEFASMVAYYLQLTGKHSSIKFKKNRPKEGRQNQ